MNESQQTENLCRASATLLTWERVEGVGRLATGVCLIPCRARNLQRTPEEEESVSAGGTGSAAPPAGM